MTFEEINKEIVAYQYPPNYMFDAETLEPYGVLAKRVEIMKASVPEFYEGGDSFLDIGSNKGFWMFHLQDKFKKLTGYELDGHQVDIAENIKELHGFENITFNVGTFATVPDDTEADVVYVGGTHHHIFAEDIKLGKSPMDFIHRLKNMAKKYLIIDGVMEYTDFAFKALVKTYQYSEEVQKQYCFENIKNILEPEFEFIRQLWGGVGENSQHLGTGGRYVNVFKHK